MTLLQRLLKKFNGLHYSQEYLCVDAESFEQALHVYLVNGKTIVRDITHQHNFTGYCPLVFAMPHPAIGTSLDNIQIIFTQKSFAPNEGYASKDVLASIWMKKVNEQAAGNLNIIYYEGIKAEHRFLPGFHQSIIQLNNRLYHKKPGNVFLDGNLYKQVQVAYAVPRNISLITVGEKEQFNLFPTDLHGPIDGHYIVSLRHEGKACQQVVNAGKILLSRVESAAHKTVYGLGKNHMQPLKDRESFPLTSEFSTILKLPIPESSRSYRELELMDSFIHGIHRIMLFRTLSEQAIRPLGTTLSHIHNSYATWRYKNGLPGNYLLR